MKKLFPLLALLVMVTFLGAATTVIQPGAEGIDTYISSHEPDTSAGRDGELRVGTEDPPGPARFTVRRSLLLFPLEVIPADANVTSAILSLWFFGQASDTVNLNASVHRITNAWNEESATWNQRLANVPWDTPGGDYEPAVTNWTMSGTTIDVWINFNITPLVIGWFNGAIPNYGIMIKAVDETMLNTMKRFRSSDAAAAIQRPKLIVDYINKTNFTVWDETDYTAKYINEQVKFFANYSLGVTGAPVTDASCNISFSLPTGWTTPEAMVYNTTSQLYEYNRTFTVAGTFAFQINCSKADHYSQSATSSFTIISVIPYVVTDAAMYPACNIVFYKISVFDPNDNPIDSGLSISIANPADATVEQLTTTTGNGGIGVYLGSYFLNATAQLGNWTIKALAGFVKGIKQFIVG